MDRHRDNWALELVAPVASTRYPTFAVESDEETAYLGVRSPQQALFGASGSHAAVSAPPKGRRRLACGIPTPRSEPHSAAAFA
jgi:hypothetical protein